MRASVTGSSSCWRSFRCWACSRLALGEPRLPARIFAQRGDERRVAELGLPGHRRRRARIGVAALIDRFGEPLERRVDVPEERMSLDDLEAFPLVTAAGFAQAGEGNVGIARATQRAIDQSQRIVALFA